MLSVSKALDAWKNVGKITNLLPIIHPLPAQNRTCSGRTLTFCVGLRSGFLKPPPWNRASHGEMKHFMRTSDLTPSNHQCISLKVSFLLLVVITVIENLFGRFQNSELNLDQLNDGLKEIVQL